MIIEIDTDNKTMYVTTKEALRDIEKVMKRGNLNVYQAIERVFFLEDLKVEVGNVKRRDIPAEESKINKMTIKQIEEDIKTRGEEALAEYNKFIEEQEKAIKEAGKVKKDGTYYKVNAMVIKSWYKDKYYVKPEKKEDKKKKAK